MTEDEFYEHMRQIALIQKKIDDLQDEMHQHMLKVAQACVNHIRGCN